MAILRDERAVAIEEVMLALDEAAEGHSDAAEILGETSRVSPILDELARRHRELAQELAREIRALGEQPIEPDPDRRLVSKVVRHGKALLVSDEALTLVRERERVEDELAALIARTETDPLIQLPERGRGLLLQAKDEVDAARRRLADARVTLTNAG